MIIAALAEALGWAIGLGMLPLLLWLLALLEGAKPGRAVAHVVRHRCWPDIYDDRVCLKCGRLAHPNAYLGSREERGRALLAAHQELDSSSSSFSNTDQ